MFKFWQLIKQIIDKNKKSAPPPKMTISNQLITDKWVMAEYFNNYCVNIGSSLAEKISPNGIDPSIYIKDRNLHTIFISPVGEDEVETIIIGLKISSPGCLHTSLNT